MDAGGDAAAIQGGEGACALLPGYEIVFGAVDEEGGGAIGAALDLRKGADGEDLVGRGLGEIVPGGFGGWWRW